MIRTAGTTDIPHSLAEDIQAVLVAHLFVAFAVMRLPGLIAVQDINPLIVAVMGGFLVGEALPAAVNRRIASADFLCWLNRRPGAGSQLTVGPGQMGELAARFRSACR
ncbi:MAG: hypothetical protein K9J42_04610 [Sulfuritalea sp.]|nr:hypothetical protein [Sulfuritalea sp.]